MADSPAPHRPLGTLGVWCPQLRTREQGRAKDIAARIERLGFEALWIPGGTGGPLFNDVTTALRATSEIPVVTGVVNTIMHPPAEAAAWFEAAEREFPGRVMLGLGASNAQRAAAVGVPYRPMSRTREYLAHLDGVGGVPEARRLLGALGPEMLELARRRTAGAHTYLVDAGHTRWARNVLGPDRLLCPVVKVATDPATGLAAARASVAPYLGMATYRRSLLAIGYSERDLAGEGSDRLMSGLVVLDGVTAAGERIKEHLAAGADHVCIQAISTDRRHVPWDSWARLASALGLSARGGAGS